MLNVNFCGIEMKNPIVAASGTFGFGLEFRDYLDLNQDVGAISVKGLTLEAHSGNAGVRIAETPSGLLNCIGLENPGAEYFKKHILPALRRYDVPILANISGSSVDDYGRIAEVLTTPGIAGFEVNISCPNVKAGGMAFGVQPETAAAITKMVKEHTDLPVITKLSPNVTDIVVIAKAVEEAGADGLCVMNTLIGMAINTDTWKPVLGNVYGGLSGPAVKPIALRLVHQTAQVVNIPIMGLGGIMSGRDAVEFLLAGASIVSVGTASMVDPRAIKLIADEMREYMKQKNLSSVQDMVGQLQIT